MNSGHPIGRSRRLQPAASGLLIFAAFCALAVVGCHRESTQSGSAAAASALPAAKVTVMEVERKARPATEEVVGTVQSRLRATVEAKVSGRILRLPVRLGQGVKAGDALAELDAQEIQARLDRAMASRDQAARDVERGQRLLNEKVVSQAEFDDLQARFRIATANVTEAETMRGYTRVAAPFNGVITRRQAEVGDLASPGKPIVDIEDPDQLRVEASVPETAIQRVALGATLPVRIAGLSQALTATVSEMAPTADPASRTFLIKADLPATPGLRPGQFGRVEVPIGDATSLRVPTSAVLQRGQLEFVMVAVSNQAQLRLVKSGRKLGGETEIVSGLDPGETIVRDGAAAVRDGQRLELSR